MLGLVSICKDSRRRGTVFVLLMLVECISNFVDLCRGATPSWLKVSHDVMSKCHSRSHPFISFNWHLDALPFYLFTTASNPFNLQTLAAIFFDIAYHGLDMQRENQCRTHCEYVSGRLDQVGPRRSGMLTTRYFSADLNALRLTVIIIGNAESGSSELCSFDI